MQDGVAARDFLIFQCESHKAKLDSHVDTLGHAAPLDSRTSMEEDEMPVSLAHHGLSGREVNCKLTDEGAQRPHRKRCRVSSKKKKACLASTSEAKEQDRGLRRAFLLGEALRISMPSLVMDHQELTSIYQAADGSGAAPTTADQCQAPKPTRSRRSTPKFNKRKRKRAEKASQVQVTGST